MTTPSPPPPRLINRDIANLRKRASTALVQYLDGSLDVLPDLDDPKERLALPDAVVVLRYPGRAWADEQYKQAVKAALAIEDDAVRAKAMDPRTLLAAAARIGTAELVHEHERMHAPLARPQVPALPGEPAPHDSLALTQQEVDYWEALLVALEGPLILP